METVFIVGGAGYVGSHCTKAIAEAGYRPVVVDNLSNGHEQFLKWGEFEHADIRDAERLDAVFARHKPAAVVLCAALIEVKDSQVETALYYDNNVSGAINVIGASERHGVRAFVFSSTCAVYGEPAEQPLREHFPIQPISPYGRTKAMVEGVLADMRQFKNFPAISLRYFNAAGASWQDGIGERHTPETHAIPLAIQTALGRREGFRIFGTDYDTSDGTAVRDYIHVLDLADAHVRSIRHLLDGGQSDIFNLGTGHGHSVKELVTAVQDLSPQPFIVGTTDRRPGDPARLVADNSKAKDILGWEPTCSFADIIESAWKWHADTEPRIFGLDAKPTVDASGTPMEQEQKTVAAQ